MSSPKDIKIGDTTLDVILENHKHWINEDCEGWEGMKANLCNVDLHGANLYNADLRYVNLRDADLSNAILQGALLCSANLLRADLRNAHLLHADLCYADLRYANLRNAELYNANLHNADLRYANLYNIDLRYANLYNIDLHCTNLYDADLRGAENIPYIPLACPSDGSFIGWKKCQRYLIKLEIPEDARRSSATTKKCRCSHAKVLGIYNLNGSDAEVDFVESEDYVYIKYAVGKMVFADSFDEYRWNECSHGIHFFINKQDAINY